VRATKPTVTATVKTAGGAPVGGGTVNVYEDGRNLGTAAVANGTATVKLKAFTTTGSHDLSVEYTGVAGTTKDSSTTVRVTVVKAKPAATVSVGPRAVHRRSTHPRLTITMTAPGQTVTGYVAVQAKDRRVALARLVHGKATVTLPTYRATGVKAVVVRYLGWSLADATRTTARFRVVR